MARYRCDECGCRMDPGEGVRYPGYGYVCEECAERIDREVAYRKAFCLTKEQMDELKEQIPMDLMAVGA